MISRASTLLFLAAWVVAVPCASSAGMGAGDARHLLMRTGFAALPAHVQPFALLTAGLGQNLFSPANVRGWPDGEAWINSTTLLMRKQFVERLFRAHEMSGDPGAMRAAMRASSAPGIRNPEKLGEAMRERFVQALIDIRFDGERWLAQFPPGDAASVQRAVLALEPVNAPDPDLRGTELLRALHPSRVSPFTLHVRAASNEPPPLPPGRARHRLDCNQSTVRAVRCASHAL